MRRALSLSTLVLLLLALSTAGAAALELREPAAAAAPVFELAEQAGDRLAITLELSSLTVEEFQNGGERFQALSFPGGSIAGEIGAPGLPVITKLVALPAGASAVLTVTSRSDSRHDGVRLMPVQPDEGEEFVLDRAAYAAAVELETVSLGEPGIFRDLRVVPVTFRPVSYDPVSGEITVAERLEIELDFSTVDLTAETPRRRTLIPESFDRLYRDTVLNYEQSDLYRAADVHVGPGTWLLIYPNSTGVLTRLQPLIDWRERQGYNVIAVNTDGTGTSTSQIKNFIQNQYDTVNPPLEFVTLAGDANGSFTVNCWSESLSGYYGEGDHYYSMLEGGDILADVHLGRLSFRTLTELDNIVDKIVTYETDPPLGDSGWFDRAGLCGDPSSSGIATIYSNQWVKSQLLAQGYSQVDTIWSGNFVNLMTSSINQGLSAFGYRGYWFMSGMSSSNILNLQNGKELPFAVIVTCDTGSFKSDNTCRSEAFLKAPDGGGIGSVGTATTGTHTRYNNTYYYGVWDGAINGSDHRLGVAHSRGKLELYANYTQAEPNKVEIWSVWNNLMGDPATDMYMDYPSPLTVSYPAQLPPGAGVVAVNVSSGGLPVADARVCIFKDGEISESAYSDAAGDVVLPMSGVSTGTLLVTVSGHNLQAHQGSIDLASVSLFPTLANHTIDDSQGDGDGAVDPGESLGLDLSLENLGSSTATSVSGTLSSTDPYVSIVTADRGFGDIGPGAEVWADGPFEITIAADAPDGHVIDLVLTAGSGLQSWTSLLQLPVQTAAFAVQSFTWSSGSTLDPGESGSLSLDIQNVGGSAANAISATLVSHSPWVTVTDAEGSWGDLFLGGSGDNNADPFALDIDGDTFPGHLASFSLVLGFNGGAVTEVELQLSVGTATLTDPTGPDAYGYYAFESTDTGHPQAPSYDWVEIQPSQGGSGSILGLSDFGWAQDDTETMALPFTFGYYGQDYDDISICSNGWVAMGTSSLVQFRNYTIPSSGSPSAMIAPLWDDWYQTSGNMVSTYYDAAGHRFIVEWYNVRNEASGSYSSFQLILLDPVYHPTATGDGEIIFQFKTVTNNDSTNGYATVGIQNQDRSDGLLLSYWNQHPSSASNPAGGRAVRILPMDDALHPVAVADPASIELTLPLSGTTDRSVQLDNDGDAGSILYYALDAATLPDWLVLGTSSGSVPAGGSDMINMSIDATGLAGGDHHYTLAVNHSGEGTLLVPITLTVITDGTGAGAVPELLVLAQNHPNPFNPKTSIRFGLPAAADVLLTVFDVNGRAVRTLVDGDLPAGTRVVEWDGRDDGGKALATGVYFYRLDAGEERIQKKMLLLK
jgi:hypothetical protein